MEKIILQTTLRPYMACILHLKPIRITQTSLFRTIMLILQSIIRSLVFILLHPTIKQRFRNRIIIYNGIIIIIFIIIIFFLFYLFFAKQFIIII